MRWFAGTVHIKPWGKVENRFPEDTWELYHVKEDFSMSTGPFFWGLGLVRSRDGGWDEVDGSFLALAHSNAAIRLASAATKALSSSSFCPCCPCRGSSKKAITPLSQFLNFHDCKGSR